MADENLPPEQETPAQGVSTGPHLHAEGPADGLGDGGKKALDAERRRANDAGKALKAMEARLKEFEDRDKTDLEKLSEARTTAEKEAQDAKSALTRYQAALRHGLSEDDFDLLGEGTEEQIEARAVKVAAKNAAAATPVTDSTAPNRRPTEHLLPGATPAAQVPENDPFAYPAEWVPKELRTN